MPDRPRIAFVSARDPSDRRAWSGLHHHLAAALGRHVGPVTALGPSTPAILPRLRRLDAWWQRRGGGRYDVEHSLLLARAHAAHFAARLARAPYDLVFAPAASTEIACLRTRLPIVYLSDATFAAMVDYYPGFSGLSRLSRCEGNLVERCAIARATAILYANDWAARSAVATYGAAAEKVHVIPFGANLDPAPTAAEVLGDRDDAGRCRLLFVGRGWQRKGGDIAVDALRHLRAMGVDAELTMVGCEPPAPIADPHVRIVPRLDQNRPEERAALARLYRRATLFLLPTRAECSAVAFCEASACALPIVATDTGGVATVVQPGVNGRLLPPAADGADYARAIRELLADPVALARLRESTRRAYDTRLNWDAWGAAAGAIIRRMLAARIPRASKTLPPRRPRW